MGLTWEEAETAVLNRHEWSRSVAQYVHMDYGRNQAGGQVVSDANARVLM